MKPYRQINILIFGGSSRRGSPPRGGVPNIYFLIYSLNFVYINLIIYYRDTKGNKINILIYVILIILYIYYILFHPKIYYILYYKLILFSFYFLCKIYIINIYFFFQIYCIIIIYLLGL